MCFGCAKLAKREEYGRLYPVIELVCRIVGHKNDMHNIEVQNGFPNQTLLVCGRCGNLDVMPEHCGTPGSPEPGVDTDI